MKKLLVICTLLLQVFTGVSQNQLQPIEKLIDTKEPAWAIVKSWIDTAKNKVEILPSDTTKAKDALYKTQVTTHSPIGAVIYSTGGLLIDNGWIRILGSGNERLKRTVPDWNKGKTFKEFGDRPSFLLVADDVVGGFFAINSGGLGTDVGKVYYLSPDNLIWQKLDVTYSEFLEFCFQGDLNTFYENYRWTKWKEEVLKVNGDKVYTFKPYLWSKEGKDINKNKKKLIPAEEQFFFNLGVRNKLGLDKKTL